MHDNYCFKCGSYTRVDDVTKLCTSCYDRWRTENGPAVKRERR